MNEPGGGNIASPETLRNWSKLTETSKELAPPAESALSTLPEERPAHSALRGVSANTSTEALQSCKTNAREIKEDPFSELPERGIGGPVSSALSQLAASLT